MLTKFMNTFMRFGVKKQPIALGRWEHRIPDKQKEMKIIWANADHCGDHICGKPYHISTNIKYYTEKAPITKK